MAPRSDEVNLSLDALDAASTALGARVQNLIDEINKTATEGLNGPQTEAVLARLAGFKTNLDAMGTNASQPFPTPPVVQPIPGPFQ